MRLADGRLRRIAGDFTEVTSIAPIIEDIPLLLGTLEARGSQIISEGEYGQIWFEMDQ